MTTTPLPMLPEPTGAWLPTHFRDYYTADQMQAYAQQARADLEAENARLREALTDTLALLESYCGDLEESTRNQARAALENRA